MFQVYGTAEIQTWNYPAKKLLDSEDTQMLPTPPKTKPEPPQSDDVTVSAAEPTQTSVAFENRTGVTYADEDDSDYDIYKSLENVTLSSQIKPMVH